MATFYAYINIHDPLVAWETAIGRYCSADNLEADQVFSISLRQFYLFKKYSISGHSTPQIINELKLENIRSQLYAHLPSRLRGVFLFESLEDAEAAAQRWDGNHFSSSFLSEIEMQPEKIAKLDSEWITSNLAANNKSSWIDYYWQGETYGIKPLTEVIASGMGLILNQDLRERAYRQVMKLSPKSIPILAVACIGFYLGFNRIAQSIPYLTRDGSKVRGIHILNMEDLESKSLLYEALSQYKNPWPPLAEPWDEIIRVPDFSSSWFELEVSELTNLISESMFVQTSEDSLLERVRNIHKTRL